MNILNLNKSINLDPSVSVSCMSPGHGLFLHSVIGASWKGLGEALGVPGWQLSNLEMEVSMTQNGGSLLIGHLKGSRGCAFTVGQISDKLSAIGRVDIAYWLCGERLYPKSQPVIHQPVDIEPQSQHVPHQTNNPFASTASKDRKFKELTVQDLFTEKRFENFRRDLESAMNRTKTWVKIPEKFEAHAADYIAGLMATWDQSRDNNPTNEVVTMMMGVYPELCKWPLEEFVEWLVALREKDVKTVTDDISNWVKQNADKIKSESSANTAENKELREWLLKNKIGDTMNVSTYMKMLLGIQVGTLDDLKYIDRTDLKDAGFPRPMIGRITEGKKSL